MRQSRGRPGELPTWAMNAPIQSSCHGTGALPTPEFHFEFMK